ncbi:MAG TPA: hypothetical protein PKM43_05320 [Verrucomicrobiota bacterium]|nr:hypothetical protein [Verrucomicrobiota bacterium]HRZ58289.1 hypothetical protein [Candidatus Paceibacterota bacterium]
MTTNPQLRAWFQGVQDHKRYELKKVLGVEYAHLILDTGDLYVTADGLVFLKLLDPSNYWLDKEWFDAHATRLSGTSSIHKIRTKTVDGRSRDIVMKWNRMGQDIPGADEVDALEGAAFNSPFEEFSLLMELRDKLYGMGRRVVVQKPLAIFVASETVDLWQSGRREHKMQSKLRTHNEVALDMHRLYAVVYEWIKGIDAHQAFKDGIISRETMKGLALDAQQVMDDAGFKVCDNKPDHIIVRPRSGHGLARTPKGQTVYALVDFELLQRTVSNEERVRQLKRLDYLKRQRDRFKVSRAESPYPNLNLVTVLGVDYVYGRVESVRGRLWVVGKDPVLYDYFLPERWRHFPKTQISVYSDMYQTITKDGIHLVLQASRVGQQPDMDPFREDEQRILEHGYNSPFEEVSLAVDLAKRGVACIYPRAIFMSDSTAEIGRTVFDGSRYSSHEGLLTPDGEPILKPHRDYIIIWGYWNGPDEKLADRDGDYYEGIHALRAYKEGLIDRPTYFALLELARQRLADISVEDLNLRGNHILVSRDSRGRLVVDEAGFPEIRLSNFEFLKRVRP